MKLFPLLLLLVMCGSANAVEFFVRSDGSNTTNCLGTTNAAYDGSGTGEACAYSNLQDALFAADYGDTITIRAGDTFSPLPDFWEPFYLPGKGTPPTGTAADYITVRSSALASLPAGRVSPSDASNMPKIAATRTGGAILTGDANGDASGKAARWWKLEGLEITNISDGSSVQFASVLVRIGGYAEVEHIWFDRCLIRPQATGTTGFLEGTSSWGVSVASPLTGANTYDTKLTNNWIGGFGGFYDPPTGSEAGGNVIPAQALGTNVLDGLVLENNFLQGAFQPWFPGGADPTNVKSATVNASPVPTTTSCTLTGDLSTLSVGDWITLPQTTSPAINENGTAQVLTKSGQNLTFTVVHRFIGGTGEAPLVGGTVTWGGDVGRNYTVTHNTFDIDDTIGDAVYGNSGNFFTGNANAGTDTFTNVTHAVGGSLAENDVMFFIGDIPAPLQAFPTRYYSKNVTGTTTQTVQVCATIACSTPINLTSSTTGSTFRDHGSGAKGYIEIKMGLNMYIEGNIFQGRPSVVAIQAANQTGMTPWVTVDNFQFKNNWMKNWSAAFIWNMGTPASDAGNHGRLGEDLLIENNLFTGAGAPPFDLKMFSTAYWGPNAVIKHNTFVGRSDYVGNYVVFIGDYGGTGATIKDNIFYFGGASDWACTGGLAMCLPSLTEEKNAFINAAGVVSNATIEAKFPGSYVASAGSNPVAFVGSDPNVLTDWVLAGGSQYKATGARDASDNTDVGANIAAIAAALTTATSAPGAPSGLNATTASSTQINLTWTDNSSGTTGETGFEIERCTGASCSSFALIHTTGSNTASYSDTGLTASTLYRYRVRAINFIGNSSYSSIDEDTTSAAPPADPSSLTATDASSSQINLGWTDASSDETGFKIERCTNAACSSFVEIATVGAGVTTYPNISLSASTLYRYRVRAYNGSGNSGYTNTAEDTTQSGGVTVPWSTRGVIQGRGRVGVRSTP